MSEIDPQVLAEIRNIQMLIGRNILVFQNVEHILKVILHLREGSGTVNNLAKRKTKIDELSLGRLSDQSVLRKIDSKLSAQSEKDLHITYGSQYEDHALDSAIKFFKDINDDRNLLVHNFTIRWPLDKSKNREKAKSWLLNQYEVAMAQREILILAMKDFEERTNAVDNYFKSEEAKKVWEDFLASDSETITFTFDKTEKY